MTTLDCPCGEQSTHVVARRRTADGAGIALWSDGTITLYFGHAIKGLPVRKPATEARVRIDAMWLFAGEVEAYDLDECALLYKAALTIARRGGNPGDVRAEIARLTEPKIRFAWVTTEADRDGRWTEQTARLDRMRWPGVVVGRTRDGYEVFYERRVRHITRDAAPRVVEDCIHETSGFRCANQRALIEFLFSIAATTKRGAA